MYVGADYQRNPYDRLRQLTQQIKQPTSYSAPKGRSRWWARSPSPTYRQENGTRRVLTRGDWCGNGDEVGLHLALFFSYSDNNRRSER